VRCFRRNADRFDETERSDLLAVDTDELSRRIDWPPTS